MHDIEPFYNWRHLYISEDDELSPFYGEQHSEIYFTNRIYNYLIHPQWDGFGSETLYVKIIFAEYELGFAVIELLGEWNDALNNDIMLLKREVIEVMEQKGIDKFIIIGENVLNFHGGDDDYYEEWFDDIEDGWIAAINFREHVEDEMIRTHIDRYVLLGAPFNNLNWRKYKPQLLALFVENIMQKKLSSGF